MATIVVPGTSTSFGRTESPPKGSVVEASSSATEAEVGVESSFGPILLTSILVTSSMFFLGVGLPMWWFTGEIWDGIGLGAFTASWGGPGFGVMAAGTIWSSRREHV